jgi:hypothetical protein
MNYVYITVQFGVLWVTRNLPTDFGLHYVGKVDKAKLITTYKLTICLNVLVNRKLLLVWENQELKVLVKEELRNESGPRQPKEPWDNCSQRT